MTSPRPDVSWRRKIFPQINMLSFAGLFVVLTTIGLVIATRQQEANVQRADELGGIMADKGGPFVNYLLVGSDTRETSDPNSPDYGGIGSENEAGGRRSDTIMIMHVDNTLGTASIMSVPRDLWIDIPGYGRDRVNAAYSKGADVLVSTIQKSLGIPLNHYIEVDFASFKNIVGALGGVDVCFEYPTRDINTGLNVPSAGCFTLDQYQSLAYARSRYYEVFRDGVWDVDGRADLGRIERQQIFLQAAISKAIQQTTSNPMRSSELINAAVNSLTVDPTLNLIETADYLRPLASGGVLRYSLPVIPDLIEDKSVLVLGFEASAVLAYFAGTGPVPPAS